MLELKSKCFEEHEKLGKACRKKDCKNWINCKPGMNCVLIAAKEGPKTLQEIGEIFDFLYLYLNDLYYFLLNSSQ